MDLVTTELWLKVLLLVRIHNAQRKNSKKYSLDNVFQEIHRFLEGKEENNYSRLS